MNDAVPKPMREPLRVLVRAADPQRLSALIRLVQHLGHVAVTSNDASAVLADGIESQAGLPTVQLGPARGDHEGRLTREASPDQIDAALRAVAAGLIVTGADDPRAFRALRDEHSILLTPREIQVLAAVSDGFANKEIARNLGISLHTVKFHLESLLRKLGASSRTEAVSRAMRLGLLEPVRL